jgi:hypothetical protein
MDTVQDINNLEAKPKKTATARDLTEVVKPIVVADWYEDGVRCAILSLYSYFTAYLGVPHSHPLAGFSYDDINLDCHGGLTYASGESKVLPNDFYWYGWDYAHAGDYNYYGDEAWQKKFSKQEYEKDWTFGEVEQEVKDVAYYFKRLINLSEKIKAK